MSKLVVSFGAGVNSAAMIVGMHERGICPDLILFADTGGEKPETYRFVDLMRDWTERNMGLGITSVKNDGMYDSLQDECLQKHTLPSLVFGYRSCSDKYKVRPQRQYVSRTFPGEDVTWAIGIDAGEKHRIERAVAGSWHPLVEWGWSRDECMQALRRTGLPVPTKSACFYCPASTKADVLSAGQKAPAFTSRWR